MPDFAEPLARLINEFKHLPGIGQKSAQRLAFHLMRAGRDDAERLAQAILNVKDKLSLCPVCNNISEGDLCLFCRDTTRDQKLLCVVEEPHNILGIETTRQFNGLYHVLHGALSPLRGISPEQLNSSGQRYRIRRRSDDVEGHGRPPGDEMNAGLNQRPSNSSARGAAVYQCGFSFATSDYRNLLWLSRSTVR